MPPVPAIRTPRFDPPKYRPDCFSPPIASRVASSSPPTPFVDRRDTNASRVVPRLRSVSSDSDAARDAAPNRSNLPTVDAPPVTYVNGSNSTSPANPSARFTHLLSVASPMMSPNPMPSFTWPTKSPNDASPSVIPSASAPSLTPDTTSRRGMSRAVKALIPMLPNVPRMPSPPPDDDPPPEC